MYATAQEYEKKVLKEENHAEVVSGETTEEYSSEDISMVISARQVQVPVLKRNIKGYRANISIGGTYDTGSAIEISTSHGYQFSPYLFLGIGMEINGCTYLEELFFPIFVDSKVNFINKKTTPFFQIRAGYSVLGAAGAYFNPNIGVSFGVGKRSSLELSIGYTYQGLDSDYEDYYYWGDYSSSEYDFTGGVTLRLGWSF